MLGHECAVRALGFVNSFLVLPWSWVWLRIQAEVFRFVYRVRYLEFVHVLKLISLFVAAVEAFRVGLGLVLLRFAVLPGMSL